MSSDFILDPAQGDELNACLLTLGWTAAHPVIRAERIGDGNMNFTIRAHSANGSFIFKQARPWVVKYPQIPAPVERAAIEAEFYRAIANTPDIANRMPRLFGFAPEAHLLWLQDLGSLGDCMPCYQGARITAEDCLLLTAYLNALHSLAAPPIPNRAMRALNHEHQYDYPLRPNNGLDLDGITPGLAALAENMKNNAEYRRQLTALGARYLSDGPTLVHGDFFPGSWLRTDAGIALIDPEFCFSGEPEYDLGVFLAHLELVNANHLWPVVHSAYSRPINWTLAKRYAGAEIMRRLIGVAQLPLPADLESKKRWLALSTELVCAS